MVVNGDLYLEAGAVITGDVTVVDGVIDGAVAASVAAPPASSRRDRIGGSKAAAPNAHGCPDCGLRAE